MAPAGISKRENRPFFVFRAPISSTDWLWPSARGVDDRAVRQPERDVVAGEREAAGEVAGVGRRRR